MAVDDCLIYRIKSAAETLERIAGNISLRPHLIDLWVGISKRSGWVTGRQISISQSAAMQSDCPATFLLSGTGHNERVWFVRRRPNGGTAMSRGDPHSDREAGQLALFDVASIVIVIFAWAVVAY